MNTPRVNMEQLEVFVNYINDTYRYDLRKHASMGLKYAIERVLKLRKLDSIEDLKVSLSDTRSWTKLKKDLLTNDTELFRDPEFFNELKSIPLFGNSQSNKILVVGCPKGQELYSISIFQKLLFPDSKNELAFSYPISVGEELPEGVYSSKEMDLSKDNFDKVCIGQDLAQFYYNTPYGVKMKVETLTDVTVMDLNLNSMSPKVTYDLVICRNKMLVFDKSSHFKAETALIRSLNVGGYIVIGFKEKITNRVNSSKLKAVNAEFGIYQKIKD